MGDVVEIKRAAPTGWHVKIVRYAERFWVKVGEEVHGTLTGTVANDLVCGRLQYGDPICFQHSEIVDEFGRPEVVTVAPIQKNSDHPTVAPATSTPQPPTTPAHPQPTQDTGAITCSFTVPLDIAVNFPTRHPKAAVPGETE